jgi:hypothetical protein
MKKYLLGLVLGTSLAYAGMVNAIAVTVNNEPITLYDIDKEAQMNSLSKQAAFNKLVDALLYDQEVKKYNINVDVFDVDDHIAKLAYQNNMDILDFKSVVSQQQNYEEFKESIKKQLKHQKLIKAISSGKLKIVSDNDMKIYYESNIESYRVAQKFDVIAYISKNKELLNQVKENPMMQSEEVMVQNLTFSQEELNAQVKYLLNSTNEKSFTPVFAQNQNYNMFFISAKKNVTVLKFEDVKESIFQTMMKSREERFLKEYFESLRITANIQILR